MFVSGNRVQWFWFSDREKLERRYGYYQYIIVYPPESSKKKRLMYSVLTEIYKRIMLVSFLRTCNAWDIPCLQ